MYFSSNFLYCLLFSNKTRMKHSAFLSRHGEVVFLHILCNKYLPCIYHIVQYQYIVKISTRYIAWFRVSRFSAQYICYLLGFPYLPIT